MAMSNPTEIKKKKSCMNYLSNNPDIKICSYFLNEV